MEGRKKGWREEGNNSGRKERSKEENKEAVKKRREEAPRKEGRKNHTFDPNRLALCGTLTDKQKLISSEKVTGPKVPQNSFIS